MDENIDNSSNVAGANPNPSYVGKKWHINALISLVIILVVILAVILYFFVFKKTSSNTNTTALKKTNSYSGWLSYNSPKFVGISFKYPSSWRLSSTKNINPFYTSTPGSVASSKDYVYTTRITNQSGYIINAGFNLPVSTATQVSVDKYTKINIDGKSFLEVYFYSNPECSSPIGGTQYSIKCTQTYNTIELFSTNTLINGLINTNELTSGIKGNSGYLFSVSLPKIYTTNQNIPQKYQTIINNFFLSIVGI